MGILELAAELTAAAVVSGAIEISRSVQECTKHIITIKVDQGPLVTLNEFEGSWGDSDDWNERLLKKWRVRQGDQLLLP
jgi:hypothetical protein